MWMHLKSSNKNTHSGKSETIEFKFNKTTSNIFIKKCQKFLKFFCNFLKVERFKNIFIYLEHKESREVGMTEDRENMASCRHHRCNHVLLLALAGRESHRTATGMATDCNTPPIQFDNAAKKTEQFLLCYLFDRQIFH